MENKYFKCVICEQEVNAGYVIVDELEIYCSDECLKQIYGWYEYHTIYENRCDYWDDSLN